MCFSVSDCVCSAVSGVYVGEGVARHRVHAWCLRKNEGKCCVTMATTKQSVQSCSCCPQVTMTHSHWENRKRLTLWGLREHTAYLGLKHTQDSRNRAAIIPTMCECINIALPQNTFSYLNGPRATVLTRLFNAAGQFACSVFVCM